MRFSGPYISHFIQGIVVKISEFIQLSGYAVCLFHSVMHIGVENFYAAGVAAATIFLRYNDASPGTE